MRSANLWTLTGRRALVTGGTQGIGLATAEELLLLGAEVWIVARQPEEVAERVAAWQDRGLPARGSAADLASDTARAELAAQVSEAWGSLGILVNNAGRNIRKRLTEYALEEYRLILETNLTSAFDLCRLLHPLLRRAGGGHGAAVVQVGSVAGLTHVQSGAPYGLTKAALTQLTRNLAVEWAADGIRVNCVAPWYIRTPLAEPVLQDPDRLAAIVARTPLQRVGEPREVAAAIAFLCLPAASYVTGHCLAVDGGFLVNGYS